MPTLLGRAVFKTFFALDRVGLHILPKHYYSPVADYRWLRTHPDAWTGRAPLTGVCWDLDQQYEWLSKVCKPYYHEVAGFRIYKEASAAGWGPGFSPIESQVVHSFIRTQAPPRVVEIGSGISTACMLHASELNEKEGRSSSQITCVEPYPSKMLQHDPRISLIPQPCQTAPDSTFQQLRPGDLLFVDSSHSVKVGSDVIRIYLDIIPKLQPGVFIHIHDIFLPYLYQRAVLDEFYGSQETALLLALLTNNQHLFVLACLSALHYDRTDAMRSLLPDYQPQPNLDGLNVEYPPRGHFPSSCWLRTT
jgi:methyltransferase family protein